MTETQEKTKRRGRKPQLMKYAPPEISTADEQREIDEYVTAWHHLESLAETINWARGQLAAQVDTKYGDGTLQEFAKTVGVEYKTLLDYKRTYLAYETSERSEVSWSVHMIFASEDDRANLVNGQWTAKKARELIKSRRDEETAKKEAEEAVFMAGITEQIKRIADQHEANRLYNAYFLGSGKSPTDIAPMDYWTVESFTEAVNDYLAANPNPKPADNGNLEGADNAEPPATDTDTTPDQTPDTDSSTNETDTEDEEIDETETETQEPVMVECPNCHGSGKIPGE